MVRHPFEAPLRQVLEWANFRKKKPTKRDGQCLFTDGVSYWVGWWSVSDCRIYARNADGTNDLLDHRRISAWASLPNLVTDLSEHFGNEIMAEPV